MESLRLIPWNCVNLRVMVVVVTLLFAQYCVAQTSQNLPQPIETASPTQPQSLTMLWLDEAMPANEVLNISGSTMQLLWPGLNNVQVQAAAVNSSRALALLQSEPNACVGNKILSPEREAISYHTQLPQVVFPGLRIFALKDRDGAAALQRLSNGDGVSLEQLLDSEHKLRLAVVGGRKYSTEIDAILQNPTWQRQLWRRHGSDDTAGVLHMLQEGRIDFVIEYPNVFAHYQGQTSDNSPYLSYPLVESPQLLAGYILCSRTPQGAALIARFDQLLAKISTEPHYLQAHLRWFDSAGQQAVVPLYNRVYNTNF